MTTITGTPLPVNWSRNNIIFKLNTDTPLTEPGLTIEVLVYFFPINAVILAPAILDIALTPDSNGDVTINLRKLLDNQLNFQLPAATGITACYSQSGRFEINYKETTVAAPVAQFLSSERYTVIKGGLPLEQWSANPVKNYFNSFTYSFRNYMTWRRPGFLVDANENRFLTYLHSVDTSIANSKAVFTIYYTDGTTQLFDLFATSQFIKNAVYHIPVGITALGLETLQPDKKIYYYTAHSFADNNALAEPYTYYVDYRNFYDAPTLHYVSSTGGIDAVRILGDIEKKINRISSVATTYQQYDALSNLMPAQEFDYQVEEKLNFSCNVGNIEDPDEQDALRDLMLSKRVYEFKYDRWRLVRILTDQLSFGNKSQALYDLPFEWTYAVTNDSYAPDNLNLNA